MYSEKKSSVGAARALPSANTSGRTTATTSRPGTRRARDFDHLRMWNPQG
jgi:hypothetical protein